MSENNIYHEMSSIVLEECRRAMEAVNEDIVRQYVDMILGSGRIFFVGVGRVKLALEAIAKRYSHLGIKAIVVGQITEPAITENDILIAGSGSGETIYPLGIAKKAKKIGAKVIHIGSNPQSSMSKVEDLFVRIPVESRGRRSDEIHSRQPMTSLFEQSLLLFGDTTALMIIERKGLRLEELWRYHANLE